MPVVLPLVKKGGLLVPAGFARGGRAGKGGSFWSGFKQGLSGVLDGAQLVGSVVPGAQKYMPAASLGRAMLGIGAGKRKKTGRRRVRRAAGGNLLGARPP
jgi:hypothetical protein